MPFHLPFCYPSILVVFFLHNVCLHPCRCSPNTSVCEVRSLFTASLFHRQLRFHLSFNPFEWSFSFTSASAALHPVPFSSFYRFIHIFFTSNITFLAPFSALFVFSLPNLFLFFIAIVTTADILSHLLPPVWRHYFLPFLVSHHFSCTSSFNTYHALLYIFLSLDFCCFSVLVLLDPSSFPIVFAFM